MSTSRVASATSVLPQALKNSPLPPKVPVPKLRTGTLKPDWPSCRYSMISIDADDSNEMQKSGLPNQRIQTFFGLLVQVGRAP